MMYPPYYTPSPRPPRTPWVAIVAIVSLLIIAMLGLGAVGFVFVRRAHVARALRLATTTSSSSSSKWSDWDSPVPVSSDDPTWGDRTAPVTIVVFGDLEDPFTARLASTLDSLKSLYGDSKLRIAWKHHTAPYHLHAREAAETGAGIYAVAGDEAFWHFEERAFANQKSLSTLSYETWASESGVDLTRLRAGMARHDWAPKVDEDERLATGLGVIGTVSYINGIKLIGGFTSTTTWQKTIDDELPLAQAALTAGVAGDRVYVTRSKLNFASAATALTAPTSTYTPPTPSLTVHNVPVGSSPVLGRADALVTIVEFADFQCPYCSRAEPTMRALRTKYGADLRIVWKNEPLAFHVRALPSAELALEARDEKGDAMFWTVHDDLFASQSTGLDDPQLLHIARDHGLDETRVRAALAKHSHQTKIDADDALAKKVGATGTPNFFINGRQLTGAQPQSSFETIIDDELAKAKARVAKGTPRTRVYDEIISAATDSITTRRDRTRRAACARPIPCILQAPERTL